MIYEVKIENKDGTLENKSLRDNIPFTIKVSKLRQVVTNFAMFKENQIITITKKKARQ